jgi:hypothetical protein
LLSYCAFALSFVPSFALADDSSLVTWAQQRVEAGIVKPLAEHAPSRFSRSRPAPRERRARITASALSRDAKGRDFIPFAVDVRFGAGEWKQDDIVGCAYRTSGSLFVKRGEAYYPAAVLFGKVLEPVSGVCQAAPERA